MIDRAERAVQDKPSTVKLSCLPDPLLEKRVANSPVVVEEQNKYITVYQLSTILIFPPGLLVTLPFLCARICSRGTDMKMRCDLLYIVYYIIG